MIEGNRICEVCRLTDKCSECEVQKRKMTDKDYDEYLKSIFKVSE